MLTSEQLKKYHEQGFISVEGAIPLEVLEKLNLATEQILEGARGLTESNELYDLEETHKPDSPRVRRLKSPFLHWSAFSDLVRQPFILDIVESILGPDLRLYNHKMNIKAPRFGAAVEWPQDWAFYPHTNDQGLAVGIYLDDVTERNGPVLMLPGSHKGPTFNHHVGGYFCGAIDPDTSELDFSSAVPLTGPAGTMTIHHVRTVHGSDINRSSEARRFIIQGYFASHAWPLIGYMKNFELEVFNSMIVRGKSTLSPKLADVPICMPLPGPINSGSIYENQYTLENRYFGKIENSA